MKQLFLFIVALSCAVSLIGCASEEITGSVRFYSAPTNERTEPAAAVTVELSKEQAKAVRRIIEGIDGWTDDCLVTRLGFHFDCEVKLSDGEHIYYIGYEQHVIYYDHYFSGISDEDIEFIKDIGSGAGPFETLREESTIKKYYAEAPFTPKRVWDRYHPDDKGVDPYFSVTVSPLGDALIEHKMDGGIYVDGKHIVGHSGYYCTSFYLADMNGDGAPELCLCMNVGANITEKWVEIYDSATGKRIFALIDRGRHDYYLFIRNGELCVKETECERQEALRAGVLRSEGDNITVVWDEAPSPTPME